MTEASPWTDIAVPSADFNVRRVSGVTATPCYWGRNTAGAFLFIVELHGDHTEQFRRNAVKAHGVGLDLRGGALGQQRLVLTLEEHIDRDLFEGLCRTLAGSLERAADSASGLAVALAHIRRWKAFLSGRNQHLPIEAVRGLFAELAFLQELIEQALSPNAAIDAWLGPEKSHQDFIFGNTAVEVKSLSGNERSAVRISSEDQLESLKDALFLRTYRLTSLPDTEGALSLNEMVTAAQLRLVEPAAVEVFDHKLVAYGYAPLPDYDEPRFVISETRSYRVRDGFPRVIRSRLPAGIDRVTYDIRLESMAPYACDNSGVFRGQ